MSYLSIVSVLLDGCRHGPNLEKQQEYQYRKLSNELLWMVTTYLKKKGLLIKINISLRIGCI